MPILGLPTSRTLAIKNDGLDFQGLPLTAALFLCHLIATSPRFIYICG
jgi:hypothetical protein